MQKLNKSIGRVILSRGALLLALAIFGIQPLAAREEVPGSTAQVEHRGDCDQQRASFRTRQQRSRPLD